MFSYSVHEFQNVGYLSAKTIDKYFIDSKSMVKTDYLGMRNAKKEKSPFIMTKV